MGKVNRKLDLSSFNAKEKTKKRLTTCNADKKLNLLSFTKEANIIDDLEVKSSSGGKTTKVDETNDEFQEDVTEIRHPELLEVMPLKQKNLKVFLNYPNLEEIRNYSLASASSTNTPPVERG